MANASSGGKDATKDSTAPAVTAEQSAQNENMRFEGEKRFRSNCGRCHAAPPKFPPRTMATIVRHMRVRATITDQDMRLILRYMTE
jgi:cytochrome c5